jgi:hypothetical protein
MFYLKIKLPKSYIIGIVIPDNGFVCACGLGKKVASYGRGNYPVAFVGAIV